MNQLLISITLLFISSRFQLTNSNNHLYSTYPASLIDQKQDTIPADAVFTKTEQEATYPGGDAAWNRYIAAALNNNIDQILRKMKPGIYTVRLKFIVSKDGTISDAQTLNLQDTKLAKVAVEAIKNSKKWNPAMQNGRAVNAYREQPVSLTVQDDRR